MNKAKRLQFMLHIRAKPKYWCRGHVKAAHADAPAINARIDLIAQRAQRLHGEYIVKGELPDKATFMLELFDKGETAQVGGFFSDNERYIVYCRGRTSKSFADSQALTLRLIKEFAMARHTRYL